MSVGVSWFVPVIGCWLRRDVCMIGADGVGDGVWETVELGLVRMSVPWR